MAEQEIGANKANFLQSVREAIGREQPLLYSPDYPPLKSNYTRQQEKVRTISAKNLARKTKILDQLVENATFAGWHVNRTQDHENVGDIVGGIADSIKAKTAVRTTEPILKSTNVDAALRRKKITPIVLASGRYRDRSELKEVAFKADLGISGVSFAIAETASCVLIPRKGIARLTSLAPPVFVAIVQAEQVLETLDDYFAMVRFQYQKNRGRYPNYTNFVSGPSRTADIEQTLTIGVHGPGVVHMVLVE